MTKDNWLTVAMIIAVMITAAATLLGPALAVIVQVRMSQPKASPTAAQEKDWSFRVGWFIGQHWGQLVTFGLICSFAMLVVVMWQLPAGRWSILLTSLIVNMMSVQIIAYLLGKLYQFAYAELNKHLDTIYDSLDLHGRHLVAVGEVIWPAAAPPNVQQ